MRVINFRSIGPTDPLGFAHVLSCHAQKRKEQVAVVRLLCQVHRAAALTTLHAAQLAGRLLQMGLALLLSTIVDTAQVRLPAYFSAQRAIYNFKGWGGRRAVGSFRSLLALPRVS